MVGVFELFAFGTLWYFVVTSIWVIALLWCVEKENPIGSGIWLILYLCFLQFMAQVNFVDQILHHPIASILWVLGYFAVGFLWSFIKWWVYVNKKAEEFVQMRFRFLKDRQDSYRRKSYKCPGLEDTVTMDTKVPEEAQEDWKSFMTFKDVIPQVKDKKGKISMWVMYWPVSMVWSLVNDFVKKVLRIIIMKCRKIYDTITMGAFKKLDVPEGTE